MSLCQVCGGLSAGLIDGVERCYKNSILMHEEYRNGDIFHRIDGPVYREWDNNEQLIYEQDIVHGEYYRIDGPVWRQWNDKGQLIEQYFIKDVYYMMNYRANIDKVQVKYGISYKEGKFLEFNKCVRSCKVIIRFIKQTNTIKRRYEKLLENSIWWSFPGLGKILLKLNGGI